MKSIKANLIGWSVFLILGSAFCYVFWVLLQHDYKWAAVRPYLNNMLSGWGYTVLISVVALVASIAIGVFLTIGQLVSFKPARWLSRLYIEFFRGTPLMVIILVAYYIVADRIGWDEKVSFGIAILSIFGGAYLAEIFRSGVEGIPKSQWLSARAIGLNPMQTYTQVVIPQAIRRVLPASAGQMANLVKDSSLLFQISVPEFTMRAKEAQSGSYATFESYLPLVIGYLALTVPISLYSRSLEKKYGFDQ